MSQRGATNREWLEKGRQEWKREGLPTYAENPEDFGVGDRLHERNPVLITKQKSNLRR